MDAEDIRRLLEEVRAGTLSPAEAAERLRLLPYQAVGEAARVDHHRELRSGIPEVVLGEFKTAELPRLELISRSTAMLIRTSRA